MEEVLIKYIRFPVSGNSCHPQWRNILHMIIHAIIYIYMMCTMFDRLISWWATNSQYACQMVFNVIIKPV